MRKIEDEGVYGVVVHAINSAIWDLGIRLNNSEWSHLEEILDVLISLEV